MRARASARAASSRRRRGGRRTRASARSSVAVVGSSVPCSAERRTSDASSSGERAEASSSWGSTPSRRRIRFAVPLKSADDRPGGAGEAPLEALDRARGRQRPGDREVLRDELAEDHRQAGRQDERDRQRDAGDGAAGTPTVSSGPSISSAIAGSARKPISRFVTRDADLRGRQLRRQASAAPTATPRAFAVALLGRALDRRAVDGDERELGGDERAAGRDRAQAPPGPGAPRSSETPRGRLGGGGPGTTAGVVGHRRRQRASCAPQDRACAGGGPDPDLRFVRPHASASRLARWPGTDLPGRDGRDLARRRQNSSAPSPPYGPSVGPPTPSD